MISKHIRLLVQHSGGNRLEENLKVIEFYQAGLLKLFFWCAIYSSKPQTPEIGSGSRTDIKFH